MKTTQSVIFSVSESTRTKKRVNPAKLRIYEPPSIEIFQFSTTENLMQTSDGGQTASYWENEYDFE